MNRSADGTSEHANGGVEPTIGQSQFTASACRIEDIAAHDWNALLPGRAEDHAYFAACSEAAPECFDFSARVVKSKDDRIVALAPTFDVLYPVPIGPLVLPAAICGIGSPLSEACPVGVNQSLDDVQKAHVLKLLFQRNSPRTRNRGVDFNILKDVPSKAHQWMQPAARLAGFVCVPTLPRASLALDFENETAYLASLKKSSRKYLRSAMDRSGQITVERMSEPGPLAGALFALYVDQQARAAVDSGVFDALSPGFFSSIARHMPKNTLILVYRIGGEIAGFSISIFNKDELLGKYVGLRQPIARDHRLYFVNWMEVVKFCLANGIKRFQAGQNSYKTKVMLGCKLERNWLYYRHPNALANMLVKPSARFIRFDTMDGELKGLEAAGEALYVE